MSEKFQIRCMGCNDTEIITENDCKGDEEPSSKARRKQKRIASKCDKCGEVRMGVTQL